MINNSKKKKTHLPMQRDTRDSGYIPGLERSLGAGNGMNLSKLWEIAKDREVWPAAVYGVTELAMT